MKKNRKLKPWVKVALKTMVIATIILLIVITIIQLKTINVIHVTEQGEYTCRGGIVKICSAPKKVVGEVYGK